MAGEEGVFSGGPSAVYMRVCVGATRKHSPASSGLSFCAIAGHNKGGRMSLAYMLYTGERAVRFLGEPSPRAPSLSFFISAVRLLFSRVVELSFIAGIERGSPLM